MNATKARLPPPGVPRDLIRWMQRTESLARHGVTVIRVGLGFTFFWFGALKFVPGMQ